MEGGGVISLTISQNAVGVRLDLSRIRQAVYKASHKGFVLRIYRNI